jgi:Beta-lactamase enzyme family
VKVVPQISLIVLAWGIIFSEKKIKPPAKRTKGAFIVYIAFTWHTVHGLQYLFYPFFRLLVSVNTPKLGLIFCFLLLSGLNHAQQPFSFDSLFARNHDAFDSVIAHKQDYRLQILYTRIDRDENNFPHLRTYAFDPDQYYYYCASMVKMPACVLTLEKLNNLAAYRVDMLDSLGVDSINCTELNAQNMMLGTPYSCLGHYIKEMFMLSNNYAFNPVYDFLGQQYFQDRLHELGCHSAVISNRFAGCDTIQNRICDPVSLYDRHSHQLKYYQPCVNNERRQFYNGEMDPQVGIGYLGSSGVINQPKDFRFANYIALSDLHKFLTRIMLPELQPPSEKLNLTRRDYQYLYKCMGIFPRESAYPKLDSIHYPDNYMKYFIGLDSGVYTMPDNIRVFNKVGQAYGFMTDCGYVVDTLNKVEFFLSCAMYLNADGILNDGVYEYDKIGYPFFHNLFNAVYADELSRPRAYRPKLSLPDFSDTLLAKPRPPVWMKIDTAKPMPDIEAVLCSLVDSMQADSRIFVNYDKIKSDEIFYRNLCIALRSQKSVGYTFDALRRKGISILTSEDKHLRVMSWTGDTFNILFQFIDSAGTILLRKPTDFKGYAELLRPDYKKLIQLHASDGNIYLLTARSDDGAEHMLAFGFKNGKPDMPKVFTLNKERYSQLEASFINGKQFIEYNARQRSIRFPLITKVKGKIKTRIIKLKFDGQVFRP